MSQWTSRLRRFDRGYLIVLAISLLAVWPFLANASLPEGTDAELHIFRLHELGYLIQGGEFYPRWAPNFYHGYGYPIFNYYAPLTYYLALVPDLLPQVDAVAAVKMVFIAGLVLAGVGIYGLVRDNWGARAGYVAAALYVYAPYVQYIDPHMRGVLPESFSFAAFALALWALDRLRRRPGPAAWLASVLVVAAVILSHNLMGLLFFGMLAAWVVWQMLLVYYDQRSLAAALRVGRRLIPALALGLGAAAFFWLPVFLERDAITLSTLLGAGDNYDFRTHFLGLADLLGPSARLDWGATQSPVRFNLGLAQWLGGMVAAALIILNRLRWRGQALYYLLAAVMLIGLMVPLSEPLWELLPFMPYFQFPWRLLGGAAAMLAVLGGAAYDGLVARRRTSERAADWLAAAAVALPLLLALPLSQPAPWPDFGPVSTLRMSQIENSGRWLGTTSTSDYVPVTVEMLPVRREQVVAPLAEGLPADRVNYEAMPDGAEVLTENVRPLLIRYRVSAPKQFRLRLYLFDFPGWRVTVDGQPATTELASPEGFIVVIVPQGEHVVEVGFGTTPARTAAWIIAAASLIAALGVAVYLRRADSSSDTGLARSGRDARPGYPVALVALAVVALSAITTPTTLFHDRSQGNGLDNGAREQYANLGDQIALLGRNDLLPVSGPGETIPLWVYWRALRPLDIDYQVFVHVLDEQGTLVAQSDKLNPGDFPTRRWPTDKYVPDQHDLQLPDDLPAGQYAVRVGMWVQAEGWRLPYLNDAGTQIGDSIPLATFEVR